MEATVEASRACVMVMLSWLLVENFVPCLIKGYPIMNRILLSNYPPLNIINIKF